MSGLDVLYLPRSTVKKDDLLGEDSLSKFQSAVDIEMYINIPEGFAGAGDIATKFGLDVQDELNMIVNKERFWEETAMVAPREGDLIYLPLDGNIFEIKFVEHEDPFYQVGKLFVFKLRCELFEYSQEDFDTGIGDIDLIEDEQAYSLNMTMNNGNATDYLANETLALNGTVVAEVVSWNEPTSKLLAKDITTTLQVGDVLNGANGATFTIASIDDRMTFNNDAAAQNLDFENKDSSYLDLSETNPFGEP